MLAQFPELGDRETQAAVDGWVEQLADLLREIEATASDLADRLRVAALNAPAHAAPPATTATEGATATQGATATPGARTRWSPTTGSSDVTGEVLR